MPRDDRFDPFAPDLDLMRLLEEEEARRRGAENAEQSLRRSLYEPGRELAALSHNVIGAAIEVHRHLGPGFTEVIYQRALGLELRRRSIRHAVEVPCDVVFKGAVIGEYRLDLVIEERLLIELKAVDRIGSSHIAQTLAYLRAAELGLALIINFNVPALHQGVKRVVRSPQ